MVIILPDSSPVAGGIADEELLVHPAQSATAIIRPHIAAINNPENFI
jgi:hypothetical protein